MLLKPKAPCFPKKGKECERCPKSTPRAEISSFNVLLNQHLQLNHHLNHCDHPQGRGHSGAQRQQLSQRARQTAAGGAQGSSCEMDFRLHPHRTVLEQKLFISAPFVAAVLGLLQCQNWEVSQAAGSAEEQPSAVRGAKRCLLGRCWGPEDQGATGCGSRSFQDSHAPGAWIGMLLQEMPDFRTQASPSPRDLPDAILHLFKNNF